MNDATSSTHPETHLTHDSSSSPTPGWKTSEFWMTLLSQASLVLAASTGALPPKYAAIAGAVSQVAYNLSRGMVKSAAATAAS